MNSEPYSKQRVTKIAIIRPTSLPAKFLPIAGNYDDWFRVSMDGSRCEIETLSPDSFDSGIISGYSGTIIAGSTASVMDEEVWLKPLLGLTEVILENSIPVLGVCFGFQVLAAVLGQPVQRRPIGRWQGTTEIHLTDSGRSDWLFDGLPNIFLAQTSHQDFISDSPIGGSVTAFSEEASVQAFRYGETTRAVQFHPEMPKEIMTRVLDWRLSESDPQRQKLIPAVRETPFAQMILMNFARYCESVNPATSR